MATYNNNSYQDPRNINLKGGVKGSGLIRFGQTGAANWGANPYSATEVGIYVNAAGKLMFSYMGTAVDLGQAAGSGFANPMTTAGAIIYGGVAGVATSLVIGTAGQVLTVNAGADAVEWTTISSGGFANPMTAIGDLIVGIVGGVPNALVQGTTGQVLTAGGIGNPLSWTTISVAQSLQAAFDGGPTIETLATTLTLVSRVEMNAAMLEFSSQTATSTGPLIKLGHLGVAGSKDILGSNNSWDVSNTGYATFAFVTGTAGIYVTNNNALIGTNAAGADGFVLFNPKNLAATALSGTQLDIEINIGGVPYYFTVFPTKA